MSDERLESLTTREEEAYAALHATAKPSAELEGRVFRALREEGLVRRAPTWIERAATWVSDLPLVPRLALAAVAVLAAFGLGVEVGRSSGEPPIPEAQLQPTAPVSDEQEIDAGILVAGAAGAETSYVRISVATKPSLTGEEDFRLYPLGED